MSQVESEKAAKQEAMKKLRDGRRHIIKATAARVKEHKKAVDAIKAQLRDQASTVPEIAEATGIKASEVLWFLATFKKYGEIIEGRKDGRYFRYCLADSSLRKKLE
jgi:predicted Rossmann fold nucleotide-binding protein DprA/Smf involved in DNA uptake